MSIIENPVTSNCLGKFAISREMVRAMPEVILVVMSKMIVVEAKSSFIHNEIAYSRKKSLQRSQQKHRAPARSLRDSRRIRRHLRHGKTLANCPSCHGNRLPLPHATHRSPKPKSRPHHRRRSHRQPRQREPRKHHRMEPKIKSCHRPGQHTTQAQQRKKPLSTPHPARQQIHRVRIPNILAAPHGHSRRAGHRKIHLPRPQGRRNQ